MAWRRGNWKGEEGRGTFSKIRGISMFKGGGSTVGRGFDHLDILRVTGREKSIFPDILGKREKKKRNSC